MDIRSKSSWGVAVAVGALAWAPSWAAAQSRPKPTKLQRELYARAFQAYRMNRFDDAVTFLSAANSIQSFDLLHYSAGRAHFKKGRCAEAKASYMAAGTSPEYEKHKEPMGERLSMALAELRAQCPGEIQARCDFGGVEVSVDDRPPVACGEVMKLPSGTYDVRARLGAKEETMRVEVEPMERAEVLIALAPDPEVVVREIREPATPWLPPTLLAAGGAGMIASVAVDVGWLGPSQAQFDAMSAQRVPDGELAALKGRIDTTRGVLIGSYALSLALMGAGGALWFLGSDEPEAPAEGATLEITPGGATWTYVW